jgi:hypothetical protein
MPRFVDTKTAKRAQKSPKLDWHRIFNGVGVNALRDGEAIDSLTAGTPPYKHTTTP